MNGLLRVPLFEDETLPSYTSRVARANGRATYFFCKDYGVDFQKLARGERLSVAMFSDICGEPISKLREHAVTLGKGHEATFFGEPFGSHLVSRKSIRFCPACFASDDADESRMPGTGRYIRAPWLVRAYATCPQHSKQIVEISPASSHRDIGVYELLDRQAEAVKSHSVAALSRPANDLDIYIEKRLRGIKGAEPLLEGLDLEVIIGLSNQIGVALIYGKRHLPTSLDDDQQREARLEGFQRLQAGRLGLDLALDQILHEGSRRPRNLYAAYGKLWVSLFNRRHGRNYDIVRSWLSEHADKNLLLRKLEPTLREKKLEAPASIAAMSETTGMSKFIIERRLAEAGLSLDDDPEIISTAIAELMERRAGGPIQASAAAKILGCQLKLFNSLVSYGVIRRLELTLPAVSKVTPGRRTRFFSEREVRDAREAIYDRVTMSVQDSMESVRRIAVAKGIPQSQIVASIFNGRYKRVASLGLASLIDDLMLDPNEVDPSLSTETHVPTHEAASMLHIRRVGISKLIERGILSKILIPLRGAASRHMISMRDIGEFNKRYVSMGYLAKSSGLDKNIIASRARTYGVNAAFPRDELQAFILRREDVDTILKG